MANDSHQNKTLEADPRFPSGPWTGFYLQPSVSAGRFTMGLSLTFCEGEISGDGEDAVGPFVLRGHYDLDSGDVTMHKAYRTHRIFYKGCADGSNHGIWGVWELKQVDRGGFHIWPDAHGSGEGRHVAEEADDPIGVLA